MSQPEIYAVVMLSLLLSWPILAIAMAFIASVPKPEPERPHAGTRNYWIIIPALNEAMVIRYTVQAALALHSSGAPVRVMVVDDGSDDETPSVLDQIDDDRLHVIRRDLPDARQGKGAAINAGYQTIRAWAISEGEVPSTVIGVLDGDGRIAPDAIEYLIDNLFTDPDVGGVQCRVHIKNRRRLLGLLQDVEFSCVANAAQSFRDLVGSVGMGGNGQFVRLTDLMRLGERPWSSCLVEDLDLGLRLHLNGVRIRYCSAAAVDQQGVETVRQLLRQRARWAQGNMECLRYLPGLLRSRHIGTTGLLDFLAYLIAPWLTVPMSIVFGGVVMVVLAGLSTGNSFGGLIATGPEVPFAIEMWLAMIFLPGTIWALWHRWRVGGEPMWRCLIAGLCYPFFLMFGVLATWRGMVRHLVNKRAWAKTERIQDTDVPAAIPAVASAPLSRTAPEG